MATGPGGRQIAVWQQDGASGNLIAAALRGAGGAWTGPETVNGAQRANGAPRAAITTSLVPVVVWSSEGNNLAEGNGSYRDGAGVWNATSLGGSQDDSVNLGDLDADGDGNALTAFRDRQGVFSAGFDAGGPRISTVSIPAGGTIGQSLGFSATAGDDNWSEVKGISWLFGDGTGADGATVSHAYGAPGGFVATARVGAVEQRHRAVRHGDHPRGAGRPPAIRAARPTPTRTGSRTAATTATAPRARKRSRP